MRAGNVKKFLNISLARVETGEISRNCTYSTVLILKTEKFLEISLTNFETREIPRNFTYSS